MNEDKKQQFKDEYFSNSFYWVNEKNFEKIQEIGFSLGIKWHTGESDLTRFDKWPHKNIVAFKHKGFQAVDAWHPNASYGEPVDCTIMISDFNELTK
jgi:uncharacterized protein (DUF1919 family)